MTEVVTAPPEAPAFRDRSVGLILFGIVHLFFGLGCAAFVLMMAVMTELAGRRPGAAPQPPASAFASNVVLYSLFALYFFSVGYGSIRRRRWSRALVLVVSWMWMLTGVLTVAALGLVLPRFLRDLPEGGAAGLLAAILGTVVVLYVAIPAVLILFYRSQHVRATCETYDPKVRWTDRVPLPVLAVVILFAAAAVSMLAGASYAVMPVMGTIVSGVPATIISLAFAGLFAFLSLQLYRLKRSAWWTLILLQVVGAVFGVITAMRTNFEELYAKMGIPAWQLRQMHVAELLGDPMLWVLVGLIWAAFFAFLLWLRRYFAGAGPRTRAAD